MTKPALRPIEELTPVPGRPYLLKVQSGPCVASWEPEGWSQPCWVSWLEGESYQLPLRPEIQGWYDVDLSADGP